MSITKELEIDKIEVVGPFKNVQIREATVIKEDGVEISRTFNRKVVSPLCSTSNESDDVKAICAVVHTQAIKDAYTAHLEAQA